MTKSEVITRYGTAANVARVLGLTSQAVQQWRNVPLHWQIVLEKMTDGELKAVLPNGPKVTIVNTNPPADA
jgi:hypothetical protein